MRATAINLLCCVHVLAAIAAGAAAQAHEGDCNSATHSAATVTARHALDKTPKDLDARIKLADALIADSCYSDAVHVLEDGEAIHGRNAELQSHLREARSMLSEQHYFEGLGRAEEAAKLSRNVLRCEKLADLEACDAALTQKPDDPQIIVAKADALVRAQRPTDAMRSYERAKELAPDIAALDEKIALAKAQRETFVSTCQTSSGEAALRACDAAFVPGGDDAFAILKRRGVLLQAANQASAALDTYIAADLLKRGDNAVALAIVSLSDSTARKDALTLAARGSALLTLGRARDAVTPLKQALALTPDLPDVKARLAQAEKLAKKEPATVADVVTAPVLALSKDMPPARRYSNAAPLTRSN